MGTTEELLFNEYHGRNSMCLSLYWIFTRNYWSSFWVALQALFLAGNFNNSVTRVHSIYFLLPASTVSSSFISVGWGLPWDRLLLVFTSSVTTVGESFMVYSVSIGSDPERSHSSIIVVLEPELSYLGSRGTRAWASFAVYSVIIGSEP